MKKLLEQRKKIKGKKPDFIRQDAHKRAKLVKKWRYPRGVHSKMRHRKKGYRRVVQVGWKSPNAVRGLHKNGLLPVLVSNVKGLLGLEHETQGVVVAGSVGTKKRIEILNKAKEMKLTVLNIANVEEYIANIQSKRQKKKNVPEKKEEPKKEKPKKEKKEEKHKDNVEKKD